MSYALIANAQKKFPDKWCAIVDTEFRFNPVRAEIQGVDLNRLAVVQDNVLEAVLEKALTLAATGKFSIVVVDSFGNNVAEINSNYYNDAKAKVDRQPGVEAKANTLFAKNASREASHNNVALVILNQQRVKFGVVFGNPYDFPGGESIRHMSSLTLIARSAGVIKDPITGVAVAGKCSITVDKSDYCVKGIKTDDTNHLVFYYDKGKAESYQLADAGVRAGILLIGAKGGTKLLNENGEEIKKWRGAEAFYKDLLENDGLRREIVDIVGRVGANVPTEFAPQPRDSDTDDEEESESGDTE
jgi:RecA/RadA recombinase